MCRKFYLIVITIHFFYRQHFLLKMLLRLNRRIGELLHTLIVYVDTQNKANRSQIPILGTCCYTSWPVNGTLFFKFEISNKLLHSKNYSEQSKVKNCYLNHFARKY